MAWRNCTDLCMRERENIVILAYCKFEMRIKLPRIENVNEKFKKVSERHKLWMVIPLRHPMVTRETVKCFEASITEEKCKLCVISFATVRGQLDSDLLGTVPIGSTVLFHP